MFHAVHIQQSIGVRMCVFLYIFHASMQHQKTGASKKFVAVRWC